MTGALGKIYEFGFNSDDIDDIEQYLLANDISD